MNADKNLIEKVSEKNKKMEGFPFDDLLEGCFKSCEKAIQEAFDERSEFFVHEILQALSRNCVKAESKANAWIGIVSLSKLRSEVGGRFQNLRDRWLQAGFPLREHRGDKTGAYEVNLEGWTELSAWILKQGYECKLSPAESEFLFEVRALEEDKI